tara:strand:- start:301 stop:645 length:345 start_codon:yes stop_codon:yes gene_type:complete
MDSPSRLTLETAIPSVGRFESSLAAYSSALELLVKSRFLRALCLPNVPNELILPVIRTIFVERRSINPRAKKKRRKKKPVVALVGRVAVIVVVVCLLPRLLPLPDDDDDDGASA